MCLAVPGKIVEISGDRLANVDMMGVEREASLDLVPDAKVGDYVLVHAGFAIEIVPEDSAQETLEIMDELMDVMGVEETGETAEVEEEVEA